MSGSANRHVEAREADEQKFEVLPVEAGFGLARLPEPSPGDVFLDFEGDPFCLRISQKRDSSFAN